MIKITTFKVGDEKINDFLSTATIVQDGFKISGDTIVLMHRDTQYPELTSEAKLMNLYTNLYNEETKLESTKLDLRYAELKEGGEDKLATIQTLETSIKNTEKMIVVLKQAIKDTK